MNGTCMLFSEMHSLRQLTLCLNYFQFILVPDWNKRVQNVPIMLIFPSWKHDKNWWKSITKIAKSLRALGRCPEPHSLPSARPRNLLQELDPTCRGSSAPTTPPQVNTLVPFWPMAQKFPLTDDHRQKEQTIDTLPSGWVVSLLNSIQMDWKVKQVFHLLSRWKQNIINPAKQSYLDFHISTLATCYGVLFVIINRWLWYPLQRNASCSHTVVPASFFAHDDPLSTRSMAYSWQEILNTSPLPLWSHGTSLSLNLQPIGFNHGGEGSIALTTCLQQQQQQISTKSCFLALPLCMINA